MSSEFEVYISAKFPNDRKHGTSGVLHVALGEKVKSCFRDPSLVDKNQFLVKKRWFQLLDLPSLGLRMYWWSHDRKTRRYPLISVQYNLVY